MKIDTTKSTNCALTLFEVLLVIALVVVLVALSLPALSNSKREGDIIQCNNNLKQVGLAYRVWEGDHANLYPPFVSLTNGGTMELCTNGDRVVLANFLALSNELSTPFILRCPADQIRETRDFSSLSNDNISYFINLIAADNYPPMMILSGDDNLLFNGTAVQLGVTGVTTNDTISWTKDRHRFLGNIGLADGSVQQVTTNGLQIALQQTGAVTNRFAIP